MSAASVGGSGLSRVHFIFPNANNLPSNPIAIQDRQYEGCVTVVPATTWLPPSYTSCVVQETPIPCYAPYPPSACPAATPTPQSHVPSSNSDSSQSQSGSQSNTSSDASVNVAGGGSGNGSQNTAIIVGVTIGAVVLLILIVVLAVWGARRRRRRTPREGRRNVMGPNYLIAGVRSDVRALDMHGPHDQRSASRAVGGGNGGGQGAPRNNALGDGRDTGRKPSAGVAREASKGSKKHSERAVSRGTPAPVSELQPSAETRKADVNPPEPLAQQRYSRHSSRTGRSRSRYRADNHDEHPQNDHLYSPGPRRERMQRRKRRQGGSADEDVDPFGESGMPNDIPLPSSPLRDGAMGMGGTGEGEVEHDVQSPSTGRGRFGKGYVPYPHRTAEEEESAA